VNQRPRTILPLVSAALLSLLVACSRTEPAESVEIIGAATPCNGCRIELGPPLELRMDNGASGVPSSPIVSASDEHGRFWVGMINQPTRVFDANGKFLSTVGKGASADDFGMAVSLMPLPGDSMLVFDVYEGAQRAFVVDSQLRVARMIRLPGILRPGIAGAWPSSTLLTGSVTSATAAGWTMHAVDASQATATVQRSFGPQQLSDSLTRTLASFQRVAPANDSGYWAADILRYRLSHFASDGTLITTIERTPDWFAVPSADNLGTPTLPPPPKLFAVWQAPDGLLWVFGRVAGRSWQEGWSNLPPNAKEVDITALRLERLFATMVEVIDPISRDVIASTMLDEFVTDVFPNGNVAVFSVDSARGPGLSVRRISLAR
jgi:hypothetical protein